MYAVIFTAQISELDENHDSTAARTRSRAEEVVQFIPSAGRSGHKGIRGREIRGIAAAKRCCHCRSGRASQGSIQVRTYFLNTRQSLGVDPSGYETATSPTYRSPRESNAMLCGLK